MANTDPLIEAGVALITGAGSGMGQAMAVKFAKYGCTKLFLVDIREDSLLVTKDLVLATSESSDVKLHVGDISSEEVVRGMVSKCVEVFGRIDFAMNNAGVAQGGVKTADMTLQQYDRNCLINERGAFLCEKYEIEQMLKQDVIPIFSDSVFQDRNVRGSIVNTCSLTGLVVLREFSAYTSSKHGIAMLTKQTAREYAAQRIRINSVCPGSVLTPMLKASNLTLEFYNSLRTQAPANRFIHADEVAETVVFLSGSRASGITGVNLSVDCGAALYHDT